MPKKPQNTKEHTEELTAKPKANLRFTDAISIDGKLAKHC